MEARLINEDGTIHSKFEVDKVYEVIKQPRPYLPGESLDEPTPMEQWNYSAEGTHHVENQFLAYFKQETDND